MNPTIHAIPQSPQPQRFSGPALGVLVATSFLVILLTFSTLQNFDRAQSLMESFLKYKGEAILKSIEAGSRASMIMMHHVPDSSPLHTLLIENSKEEDILFIIISDRDGTVVDRAGSPNGQFLSSFDIERMVSSGQAATSLNREAGVYVYSRFFTIGDTIRRMQMPVEERDQWQEQLAASNKIISIGLLTEEFDIARKQDVRHAIFMAAILFLVGSSGIYALFLYQKMRMTSSTLADMKLYTDSIIESIPVSLVSLDADDRVVSSNHNAELLFGKEADTLQGQPVHKIIPACAGSITKNCNITFEQPLEIEDNAGQVVPIRLSCSPLINQENSQIGKVLVIRDMSSMRDMEIQLERSRRMAALGKMAAGIAHEIRNPLGTLRGFAHFFGSKAEANEEDKVYTELMIGEIDRLNLTISALLQFSRPREPQFQPVSIDELFARIGMLLSADLANNEVRLHCNSNTGTELFADPDLLLQVLMNLSKNSIHASKAGGEVILDCQENEYTVRLSITDFGCGMTEKERERMFDPFFTTTRTGTGLGLAVSYQIVEQHHGKFEVVTQKDKGTTITIVLPK